MTKDKLECLEKRRKLQEEIAELEKHIYLPAMTDYDVSPLVKDAENAKLEKENEIENLKTKIVNQESLMNYYKQEYEKNNNELKETADSLNKLLDYQVERDKKLVEALGDE